MTQNQNNKLLPFWEGLIYPFAFVHNNSSSFFMLTSFFALLNTICTFALGRSALCSTTSPASEYIFCSNSIFPAIFSIVLFLLFASFYINRLIIISQNNTSIKELITNFYPKSDIKSIIITFLTTIIIAIFLASLYFLTTRKATPNFYLELGYFILFSSLIILSISYLLGAVLLYRYLINKTLHTTTKIFWPIIDNLYKYLLWFLFAFLFFSWILKSISTYLISLPSTSSVIPYIISEFLLSFTTLSIFAYWILQLQYQEKKLYINEQN